MHSTGRRSIPKAQSSSYLDLYMLQKERERLEKERSLLEKRGQGIEKRLKEIQQQIEALEKSAKEGGGTERAFKKGPSAKQWKTMALKY
jgi:prefoldin subunit 5